MNVRIVVEFETGTSMQNPQEAKQTVLGILMAYLDGVASTDGRKGVFKMTTLDVEASENPFPE